MTDCLGTGMGEENWMTHCNHTGTEYTPLNLVAGTVLLLRSATGPAGGDCKFHHSMAIMQFSAYSIYHTVFIMQPISPIMFAFADVTRVLNVIVYTTCRAPYMYQTLNKGYYKE